MKISDSPEYLQRIQKAQKIFPEEREKQISSLFFNVVYFKVMTLSEIHLQTYSQCCELTYFELEFLFINPNLYCYISTRWPQR
jgi:hypothetical protein